MAYDPNFPFGYTPYYQQQRQAQPQMNTYAFVSGLEGAKQYNIPANQSILLMDNAQPVCYLKQANALGQTSLKCFKLIEVSEADLTTPAQPKVEYATKEDIKALNSRIDALIPKEK
jgi:hypothetical protein